MQRRHFIRNLVSVAAAQVVAPAVIRAEVLASVSAHPFNRALEQQRWLLGWQSVSSETLGPSTALVEGEWPRALQGVLYRNGPAWFEREGFRYQHWFDGDGMVHAWRIVNGTVEHRARLVATSKFTREQRAGRFLIPAAGTTIPAAVGIRNPDDANTANTAVIRLGGRLYALWEGGSATELHPDSLLTKGPVAWRDDLIAAPFSAHPLLDRDGTLWNFGMLVHAGGSGLLLWRIRANGRLAQIATLANEKPGYLHSFAMTERHLVFMFVPYSDDNSGGAYFERLRFAANQPSRIAVVPKSSLDAPLWFEADFCATYHFADAYEHAGEIVARLVRQNDVSLARSPMAAAMRGERDSNMNNTSLVGLRLELANRRARWESYDVGRLEFPTFDPRSARTAAARIYAPTFSAPNNASFFNAIACIDTERGRRDVYRYGSDVMAEEHCFVPQPGSRRAGQGWLIGRLLDYRNGRSGIAVLDAERVANGPLAQAWVPYTFPLGFHGGFAFLP
jgi:all-trans-8'-apo-beta-carotenal 15,15'-oxygenase